MMKGMLAALCMVILVVAHVHETAAVTCNPSELKSCAPALSSGANPPAECCSKLKEQQPCFCKYVADPSLSAYIRNPKAKKLLTNCGIPIPTCPLA